MLPLLLTRKKPASNTKEVPICHYYRLGGGLYCCYEGGDYAPPLPT